MAGRDDDIEDHGDVEVAAGPNNDKLPGAEDQADDQDDDLEGGEDDSDDQDDDSDDGEGDSDDSGADDESAPKADAAAGAKKPKATASDRIKELARLRRDAERTAFDLELKNIELEKRLAAAGGEKPAELPKAPNPKDFPYGEVDPDYLSAIVDHKVAVRTHEIQAKAAEGQQAAGEEALRARYATRYSEVAAAGEKKFPGFKKLVETTPFDVELARMVLDSENAVDIANHLVHNISELRELTRLNSTERARRLGRLEGKMSATSAVKKTKAPDPLGSRKSKEPPESVTKYGPESQDSFDKAFFMR